MSPIYQHDLPQPPRVRKPNVSEVAQFGGLRLDVDPQELGWQGAIDLKNVDLRGDRVQTRDGYATFYTNAAESFDYLFGANFKVFGSQYLFAVSGSDVFVLNTSGTLMATSAAGLAGSSRNMVQLGTATDELVYAPRAAGSGNILKFDPMTLTFSSVAAGYSGAYAAVQPSDNRLVLALDETGHESRVRFSNAGAPTTFSANDYVDLTPYDGSVITGAVAFNGQLFVFKSNKFAVFYGNSTDASGNPVFNYRWVDTGIGAVESSNTMAVCVGPDGVYFVAEDGVYRTTGGPPQKISAALDPLFRWDPPPTWTGGSQSSLGGESFSSIAWHDGRLYVGMDGSSTDIGTFIWDPDRGWTYWDTPGLTLTSWANASLANYKYGLFFTSSNHQSVLAIERGRTNDAGGAINSHYRTGYADFGTPGSSKILREVLVDGYGTPTLKLATNDGDLDSGVALTLGTAPNIAQARRRSSVRGRNVGMQLSGTSPWSASRAIAHARGERPVGLT